MGQLKNYMYNEFIWKDLQTMISWEDVVKVASVLMLNTETGVLLDKISQN